MEYAKHYGEISFIVRYSFRRDKPAQLSFAAQPLECRNERERDHDFMFGRIDGRMDLQVGFKDFLFPMNKDFHKRLGILYERIREEYVEHANLYL
jgi:hypothetical protein